MNKQARENYQSLWNEFIEVLPALVKNGSAGLVKEYTRKLNSLFTDIFETTDKNPVQTVENHSSEAFDNDGMMPGDDMVSHPPHYTNGSIECIDAMKAAFGDETVANFCICNAFKYIWRHMLKNGRVDIDKAIWYLNKYKELSNE